MPRPVLPAILLCAGLAAPATGRRARRLRAGDRHDARASAPGDWLSWRRTQNGWAYSPLDADQQAQRRAAQSRCGAQPMGDGGQEATPLVYGGMMYVPNRGDYVQAFDAATGELLWEYQRQFPEDVTAATNRNLAIWGTTLIDAGGDNMLYAIDARNGKLVWETHDPRAQDARARDVGSDHRQRQDHHGPAVPARGDARSLRRHGARRGHRPRAVARAHDPAARRARRRELGRRADGAALARRHVDGAELRSRRST